MKYITTTAIALLIATSAQAEERIKGKVWDEYRTVTESTPTTRYECYDQEIPIYGRTGGGASSGDILGGLILGGILGKGVSGNDQGAAAGAVLGGMIAADNKQGKRRITGYRTERVCEDKTTYVNVERKVYSHSIIDFRSNGERYQLRFQK
jgi:uncharacterized protein YcfJ